MITKPPCWKPQIMHSVSGLNIRVP